MRKYFSVVGALFYLLQKNLSLIPTGSSQMHTLNLKKIFYPFTYLELRSRNAPCFYKKFEKYFFRLRVLILLAQKVPSLIPTGRGHLGIVVPKKGKKICPPGVADRDILKRYRQSKEAVPIGAASFFEQASKQTVLFLINRQKTLIFFSVCCIIILCFYI